MSVQLSAPADLPAVFRRAVAGLSGVDLRPEVAVSELPAPRRLAPHAVAVQANVCRAGEELADGRLVILHDPEGQETWEGDTLRFGIRALGQRAAAVVEVLDDAVRIEVSLPWLLAKAAKGLLGTLRKQTTLLLEKK